MRSPTWEHSTSWCLCREFLFLLLLSDMAAPWSTTICFAFHLFPVICNPCKSVIYRVCYLSSVIDLWSDTQFRCSSWTPLRKYSLLLTSNRAFFLPSTGALMNMPMCHCCIFYPGSSINSFAKKLNCPAASKKRRILNFAALFEHHCWFTPSINPVSLTYFSFLWM